MKSVAFAGLRKILDVNVHRYKLFCALNGKKL